MKYFKLIMFGSLVSLGLGISASAGELWNCPDGEYARKAGGSGSKSKESINDSQKISKLIFSVPIFLNAHHRGPDTTQDAEQKAIDALKVKSRD